MLDVGFQKQEKVYKFNKRWRIVRKFKKNYAQNLFLLQWKGLFCWRNITYHQLDEIDGIYANQYYLITGFQNQLIWFKNLTTAEYCAQKLDEMMFSKGDKLKTEVVATFGPADPVRNYDDVIKREG